MSVYTDYYYSGELEADEPRTEATPARLPVAVRAWVLLAVPTTLWIGGLLLVLAAIG